MKKNKFIALALAAGMTFCNVAATGVVAYAETADQASSETPSATDENLDTEATDTNTNQSSVPTKKTISSESKADAEGEYTISVKDGDTHTYTVYQVLTGTLIAGEEKLGNPKWGANASAEAKKGKEADFINTIKGKTGVALAEEVAKYVDTNSIAIGTVTTSNSLDVVPGYYMIIDTTDIIADGDSRSLNIVAVFNDIQITPKKGTTQSDKKIDDINDSDNSEDDVVWQDTADYDLGDAVPFKLSATIAEDYDNYTHGYKLTFHDTESKGLTFNKNTVKVLVDGSEITSGYEVVTTNIGTETFQVKFANLKAISSVKAGSVITVTYNSTLTGDSVVYGNDGNPNTSHVTYSNNPNASQAGEEGKTPDDTVVVFTYKLDIDKVDPELKKLKGAEFSLEKKLADGKTKSYGFVTLDDDKTQFEFKGIDDGDYILTETKTPTGYNTIQPIEFTVSASHAQDNNALLITDLKATGLEKDKDGKDVVTTGDVGTGIITANVVNSQGAILPSTGGMGTTILYVIGGILVIGGGAAIFIKRKKDAE